MIVVAGMMRHIIAMSGIDTPLYGLMGGFGIGLFFITPVGGDELRLCDAPGST